MWLVSICLVLFLEEIRSRLSIHGSSNNRKCVRNKRPFVKRIRGVEISTTDTPFSMTFLIVRITP